MASVFLKNKASCRTALRLTVLLACALLSGCTAMLFQPMAQHVYTPDVVQLDYTDLALHTADGLILHGWKLMARGEHKGSIVFLHGNGENISTHFGNLYWLMYSGYDGYIFDYRGYGKSEGVAELDGVIRDAAAMIDHVIRQTPDDKKVIVIGHSLGGALAIHAVANSPDKDRIATLVTIEAFSDYRAVTRDVLATSWLTWALQWPASLTINNDYAPLDFVAGVSPVPLLILHSRRDRLVPFYHAERLYQAALSPKRLAEIDSDHNHIFNHEKNRRLLLDYLNALE